MKKHVLIKAICLTSISILLMGCGVSENSEEVANSEIDSYSQIETERVETELDTTVAETEVVEGSSETEEQQSTEVIESTEESSQTEEMQFVNMSSFKKICNTTQLEMLLPYVSSIDNRKISNKEFDDAVFVYWRMCYLYKQEVLIKPVDDSDAADILFDRAEIEDIYKVFTDDELENKMYGSSLTVDSEYAHVFEASDGKGIMKSHIYEARTNGKQAVIKYGVNWFDDYSNDYVAQYEAVLNLHADNRFGVELQSIEELKDTVVDVTKVTASSQLKDQGSHNYKPENLIDGNIATAWVEGVSGYGEGESVTLYFDETDVSGFQIYTGYGASDESFMNNAYVKEVMITDDQGFSANFEVGGDWTIFGNLCIWFPQTIHTDHLTFTITKVGTSQDTIYEDTCISEITLYMAGQTDQEMIETSGSESSDYDSEIAKAMAAYNKELAIYCKESPFGWDEYSRYAFVYLDDDEIPELLISMGRIETLWTYKDSKIVDLVDEIYNGVSPSLNRNGYYINSYRAYGTEVDGAVLRKYENGKITEVASWEASFDGSEKYYVNDEEVSKTTYDEAAKQYKSYIKSADGKEFSYNDIEWKKIEYDPETEKLTAKIE